MGLTVRDRDTDVEMTLYTDGFANRDGCLTITTRDVIGPGRTFTVSSASFGYNLVGHNLRATILLCSNTGQSGTCVTRTINFKP
jgi:hypothetical protein